MFSLNCFTQKTPFWGTFCCLIIFRHLSALLNIFISNSQCPIRSLSKTFSGCWKKHDWFWWSLAQALKEGIQYLEKHSNLFYFSVVLCRSIYYLVICSFVVYMLRYVNNPSIHSVLLKTIICGICHPMAHWTTWV